MFRLVPNELNDCINKNLDEKLPQEAQVDREYFYNKLLNFYDENGYVPDFAINKKEGK